MKHRLLKLAILLILGAIVNVAVAWTLAWFISMPRQASSSGNFTSYEFVVGVDDLDQPSWYYSAWWRAGSIQVFSVSWDSFDPVTNVGVLSILRETADPDFFTLPSCVRPARPLNTLSSSNTEATVEDLRGWPAYSMRCSFRTSVYRLPSPGFTINGIELPFKTDGGAGFVWMGARALPLRPIWPGFAINTIFYATILWVITLVPFTARRIIRRKRGRCIKCGYDLRETPDKCPECGWGREADA